MTYNVFSGTLNPTQSINQRCPVCPVCLSVTLVYCGQTVGQIKMKLGTQVGPGPGHIVLDRDQAPPKGHSPSISGPCPLWPTAGSIKMPLAMEVGLAGPGDFVLDADPTPLPPPKRGAQPHDFCPMSIVPKRARPPIFG